MEKEWITEKDTIYEIVTKFPGMREKLLELSPKFERLNNPIMFNTVAKVTTIRKAADFGKLYLREMLYQLNEVIGKSAEYLADAKKEIHQKQDQFLQDKFTGKDGARNEPDWLPRAKAYEFIDVRGMTEDPFTSVIKKAQEVKPGGGFVLVQKFEPLPLISYLESLGFEHYIAKVSDKEFQVYLYKKA